MTDAVSQAQYALFDFMPGFVGIVEGPRHVYAYVNDAYREISGPRDFIGRTMRDVFPELEGQGFHKRIDEVYATGIPYSAKAVPVRLEREEGDRVVDFVYNPIRDAAGAVTGVFIGGYDVTDAHRAQERWKAIAEFSDRLRMSGDAADVAAAAAETVGKALGVGRVGFGTIDEASGSLHVERDWAAPGIESLVGANDLREFGALVASLRRDEVVAIADVRTDDRTAAAASALETLSVRSLICVPVVERGVLVAILFVNHPRIRGWRPDELLLVREVAERTRTAVQRQRTESALHDSEALYRRLFDSIDEGFCIIEFFDGPHGPLSDYIHVEANDAYARHAGIPNVVGQKLREMVPAEADDWVARYGAVLRTGEPIRFEQELIATGRYLELSAVRIEPPSRKQVAVLFQDVTARKRAEQAMRESEEQFRAFAQAVPNHVWASRPNGEIFWFNDRVYAYSGAAEGTLDGAAWAGLVHPDDLDPATRSWAQSLATGEVYETSFRIRRADGAWRWFLVRAQPVRDADGAITSWIGTNTDIETTRSQAAELARLNATLEQQVQDRTGELMAAEEALRQSQKMEAVGQLTGGLAHDFNNLLAGITGSLELLGRRVAQGRVGEVDRYLTAAQGAARRATALTHRLLAFSRRQTLDPKPTDINRLVKGMDELVRRTVGPSIAVEVVAAAGLWPTLVDPNQLENALLNLCINARDAMPGGGMLTIETGNRWMDDRAARERDMPPGQYISMCVSDNGTGMPPEVVARAFDPFFTTKPIGQGTGLGLSMIYGFARQSGGQVRIYSEVGQGTMVCIYLPRHVGEEAAEEAPASPAEAEEVAQGETVLVVDDEAIVRMLVVEVLQELGYVAIEAVDGPSGLKILQSDQRIDLLVTDVGLPGGMNGRQMADAARLSRPDLKILFITGYAENAVVGHGHLDHGMHVMTKPFALEALAARIRELIASN